MAGPWRYSILARVAIVLIASFALVSIASMLATIKITEDREYRAALTRLNQLLDAVEGTVSAACFVKNNALADDVALGLMKNSDVLAVTITSDRETLAQHIRANAHPDRTLAISRLVHSPFAPEKVLGEIELLPNTAQIQHEIDKEVRLAAMQLGALLALTALVVVAVMLFAIVRPIKAMSDRLHRMNATTGDRLRVKRWLKNTEIGRLAEDVNQLAACLVAALDEEHTLRLRQETEEKKYHSIFENAESGIFITDRTGRITSWNPAFQRILDLADEDAEGATITLAELNWEAPEQLAALLRECTFNSQPCTRDVALIRPDATRYWLNIVLSPIDENTMQGVVHDVTDLKEAETLAKRLAVTDTLTGLANRLGLEQHMSDLVKTGAQGFTLILADLDNFKQVNDGLGLPIGDAILKIATARLSSCVKNQDTVARISADLFGILLPNVTLGANADNIAVRIMDELRQTYFIDGSPIKMQASLGITLFPNDGDDPPSLLRNAELALDRAKAGGGNAVVFFDPTLALAAEQRRHMENDLRLAIQNHQFVLFYQPIVDLPADRLAGAEALIRWRHPERGMIAPDAFIPIAEATGLIDEIGLWVLETACRQLADWQQRGLRRYISLNVSGRQIPRGLPPEHLAEVMRRHGVDPAGLALEITEGILMADVEKAQAWLNAVRNMGCRIYLDDFGTGYSSLSYLKRFPVDTLKVDKSFVGDMSDDSSDRTLVAAVVAMARSLAMDVVAEGVENAAQLRLLRQMGCRYAQGYYFSRPLPIDDFDTHAERIDLELSEASRTYA